MRFKSIPTSQTPTYIRLDIPEYREGAIKEINDLLLAMKPDETWHIQIKMEGCVIGGFGLLVESVSDTRIVGSGYGEQEDAEFFEVDCRFVLEKRDDLWWVLEGVTEYGGSSTAHPHWAR
jgi:hypothetical protein